MKHRLRIGGSEYLLIPEGRFLVGSKEGDPEAFTTEFPQHELSLDYSFWCARFPITNLEFSKFVEETKFITLAEKLGWAFVFRPGPDTWEKVRGASWQHPVGPESRIDQLLDHPAVSIGFNDALAYVEWLNIEIPHNLPEGYQFSLPSEVEWEKAARGPNGNRYPWGDDFNPDKACWYESRQEVGTTSVGTYSSDSDSFYGCAGMAGNIWEWTTTLWGPEKDTPLFSYPYRVDDGREDQVAGKDFFRVIRGGSFKNNPEALRSACRDIDPPSYALNNLGFRVFITPKKIISENFIVPG
jgi:formylglycine-generating enzyme required for sulfatase activity